MLINAKVYLSLRVVEVGWHSYHCVLHSMSQVALCRAKAFITIRRLIQYEKHKMLFARVLVYVQIQC